MKHMGSGKFWGLVISGALLVQLAGCDESRPKIASYRIPKETPAPAAQPARESTGGSQEPAQKGTSMPTMPGLNESTAGFPQPTWSVPAGWEPLALSGPRRGAWRVSGPDGTLAEVVVTVFPGDVGGLAGNVNRWRGQLGLPPVAANEAEASATALRVPTGNGWLVYIEKPAAAGETSVATAAVILPHKDATWFVKMTGDIRAVGVQRAALVKFAESIQFP